MPFKLSKAAIAHYEMWDGEVCVTVIRHVGMHGFHSASATVRRVDSPIEVKAFDGYVAGIPKEAKPYMVEGALIAFIENIAKAADGRTSEITRVSKYMWG